MKFFICTLFPEMFAGPLSLSIIKRAQEKGIITIEYLNIRDFAQDKYGTVDEKPFGGGVGMIMKVDVIDRAISSIKEKLLPTEKVRTILLDPKGDTYSQAKARDLSHYDALILISGHYEGVDARVYELIDETISIGDYVLTGGEIPTMVLVDSITRLIPHVLRDAQATQTESFSEGYLEYPQYTRPQEYKGMIVPEVLLSGNHKNITDWRKKNRQKIVPQR